MRKRIISVALAMIMILSLCPLTVLAAGSISAHYQAGVVTVTGSDFNADQRYTVRVVNSADNYIVTMLNAVINSDGSINMPVTTGALAGNIGSDYWVYVNGYDGSLAAKCRITTGVAEETGIVIVSNPAKTGYKVGETLDITGLVVNITYSDHSAVPLTVTQDMISGFSSTTEGTKTVTITYKTFTAAFTITVSSGTSQPGPGDNGGGYPGGSGGDGQSQPGNSDADILINGKTQAMGTVTTTTQNNQSITRITVNPDKLADALKDTGDNAHITINDKADADRMIVEFNGQMIQTMGEKAVTLDIRNEQASYTIPAGEINIEAMMESLGENVKLSEIKVAIEISRSSKEEIEIAEDAAKAGKFSIVVPPVQFSVFGTFNDKTVEVSKFNSYVERTIAIPDGVDPKKITTGIVVEPDGTVRHVPTKIIIRDGKYYAQINSLTNSVYSVIWNSKDFSDVKNHWAKEAINDMGARLIISGVGNNMFEPDRNITRAEFATIIVRALGLKPGTGHNPFSDVVSIAGYTPYIETAYNNGIIAGYGNGKFGPDDVITREQAMVMLTNAMRITELNIELDPKEVSILLSRFDDSAQVVSWARKSIAVCSKAGIIPTNRGTALDPKDEITRAETAYMVRKLLQKSGLI